MTVTCFTSSFLAAAVAAAAAAEEEAQEAARTKRRVAKAMAGRVAALSTAPGSVTRGSRAGLAPPLGGRRPGPPLPSFSGTFCLGQPLGPR